MFFPTRLILGCALVLVATNICHANPVPPPPIQQSRFVTRPFIQIEAITPGAMLRLNGQINHGDVIAILAEIALRGNLQVAVKPGVRGFIETLSFKESTPEAALQKVCESAGLGCELKGDIWFVWFNEAEETPLEKTKLIASLSFVNIEVTELLEKLAQFNLHVAIVGDVKGQVPLFHIHNKTPSQALDLICLVADLQIIEETDDGTFIVSQKQP